MNIGKVCQQSQQSSPCTLQLCDLVDLHFPQSDSSPWLKQPVSAPAKTSYKQQIKFIFHAKCSFFQRLDVENYIYEYIGRFFWFHLLSYIRSLFLEERNVKPFSKSKAFGVLVTSFLTKVLETKLVICSLMCYIHRYIMEKQNIAELVQDKKRVYPKFD